MRRTITVSITQEQDDLIRACLASGRYASTSEIIRAALRQLERDEAATRDVIRSNKPKSSATRV
ncbi:type II toxin-antitoxin system ParD family antitoxin [Methylorubrum subtropicum]|uniref:ribbon-helix-helix domain-containing protein n=1 Tax=Methylorubrum subtropicum TaxID=3138812 RepID=UPI00399D5450